MRTDDSIPIDGSRFRLVENHPEGPYCLEFDNGSNVTWIKLEVAVVLELERIANALERMAPVVLQETEGGD